jgi:hypothetical protein
MAATNAEYTVEGGWVSDSRDRATAYATPT